MKLEEKLKEKQKQVSLLQARLEMSNVKSAPLMPEPSQGIDILKTLVPDSETKVISSTPPQIGTDRTCDGIVTVLGDDFSSYEKYKFEEKQVFTAGMGNSKVKLTKEFKKFIKNQIKACDKKDKSCKERFKACQKSLKKISKVLNQSSGFDEAKVVKNIIKLTSKLKKSYEKISKQSNLEKKAKLIKKSDNIHKELSNSCKLLSADLKPIPLSSINDASALRDAKTFNGDPGKYGWCVKVSHGGKNYTTYINEYILKNIIVK